MEPFQFIGEHQEPGTFSILDRIVFNGTTHKTVNESITIVFQYPDINMSGLPYNMASPMNACCGVISALINRGFSVL